MMVFLLSLVVFLSGLISQSLAHYTFGILKVNNTESSDFQYVRSVTRNQTLDSYRDPGLSVEFAKLYPHTGVQLRSVNFTCGREAWLSAPETKTATILAGSEISFIVSPHPEDSPIRNSSWDGKIFHEGPAEIYMAKLPPGESLETWRGDDGDWFKIAEFLGGEGKEEGRWMVWHKSSINFTVPETTPPGKYLVRVEQFTWWPEIQFYLNCAHVEVVGAGGGVPTDFVKFPGAYFQEDVERHYREEMQHTRNYTESVRNYKKNIGPKVWRG